MSSKIWDATWLLFMLLSSSNTNFPTNLDRKCKKFANKKGPEQAPSFSNRQTTPANIRYSPPFPSSCDSTLSTNSFNIFTRAKYLSFASTITQGACLVWVRSIMSLAARW